MIPGPHRSKGGATQLGIRPGEPGRGPFGIHHDSQDDEAGPSRVGEAQDKRAARTRPARGPARS